MLLVLGVAAYSLGGAAYGKQRGGGGSVAGGAAGFLAAHPHRQSWSELAGLCKDGLRFSQAKLLGHSSAGADQKGGAAAAADARSQSSSTSSPKGTKGKLKGEKGKKGKKGKHGGKGKNSGPASEPSEPGEEDLESSGTERGGGGGDGLGAGLLAERRDETVHSSQARIEVLVADLSDGGDDKRSTKCASS